MDLQDRHRNYAKIRIISTIIDNRLYLRSLENVLLNGFINLMGH